MKDVRIDYQTNWQKLHYRGIISAYRSSPFFEYYWDQIEPVLLHRHSYLIDLNYQTASVILSQLEVKTPVTLSTEFSVVTGKSDYRNIIDPKVKLSVDREFIPTPYTQVFSDRYGFIPNLSILDLLFNGGKESVDILRQSLVKLPD
jgi:hypothetical protein